MANCFSHCLQLKLTTSQMEAKVKVKTNLHKKRELINAIITNQDLLLIFNMSTLKSFLLPCNGCEFRNPQDGSLAGVMT